MRIYTSIDEVKPTGPVCLTIGNFDGIHRGHQALVQKLLSSTDMVMASETCDGQPLAALLTFAPHPLSVLRPDHPLHLLTTPLERLSLAAKLGLDIGIMQPFTPDFAKLTAREFIQQLKEKLNLACLVVGPDFALGHGRTGNLDRLRELGGEFGYELIVMEPIDWQGKSVRSSHIRTLLLEGDVEEAQELLGRPYHATGIVVKGDKRGRQIGVPTANLQTQEDKLLPPNGVYATRTYICKLDKTPTDVDSVLESSGALWSGDCPFFNSVTNLGVRPTVDGHVYRFETHLLDFPPEQTSSTSPQTSGNLYGRTLHVEFIARLRDEKRFTGLDELVAQIQSDIATARRIL